MDELFVEPDEPGELDEMLDEPAPDEPPLDEKPLDEKPLDETLDEPVPAPAKAEAPVKEPAAPEEVAAPVEVEPPGAAENCWKSFLAFF